ncbi:MAG TPA: FAD-binding oxidoreductase [Candidatus Macondimonas sp.]|nr:FAD-binding oxidoreductase [Candidatus Macondimonas sp.]
MSPLRRSTAGCIDTLIVGRGLAGTLLAFELARAGQRVMIADRHSPAAASRATGGLMNPLTGPRLSPLPDLVRRCSAARAYYERLSRQLCHPLVTPLPIWRICRDAQERDRAIQGAHPCRGDWRDEVPVKGLNAPFGAFPVHHGWRLDVSALCSIVGRHNGPAVHVGSASFDWGEKRSPLAPPRWRGHAVGAIVSCEGVEVLRNPFWRDLPLLPDGGESLLIRLDVDLQGAISAGITLVPVGGDRYWLGATHQPGQISAGPTGAGRTALLQSLTLLLDKPWDVRVVRQRAGTRVAPPDREPVVGRHPRWPWLWIFNGLGSRGILRAPEAAEQLAAHMTRGTPLSAHLDVARYGHRFDAP